MQNETLLRLALFIPTILSLTVHEWAHAASARALGDDTAQRQGRLTLNPIVHMDPLGTLLLPLVQIFTTGYVMFAWAKPVPYDPTRFRRDVNMSTGSVIVAAAGPMANVVLGLAAAVTLGFVARSQGVDTESGATALLLHMVLINAGLAVFNLLPVPPLDGSKVLYGLLPRKSAAVYERFMPYAPVMLFGLMWFGSGLLRAPIVMFQGLLFRLSSAIAG